MSPSTLLFLTQAVLLLFLAPGTNGHYPTYNAGSDNVGTSLNIIETVVNMIEGTMYQRMKLLRADLTVVVDALMELSSDTALVKTQKRRMLLSLMRDKVEDFRRITHRALQDLKSMIYHGGKIYQSTMLCLSAENPGCWLDVGKEIAFGVMERPFSIWYGINSFIEYIQNTYDEVMFILYPSQPHGTEEMTTVDKPY